MAKLYSAWYDEVLPEVPGCLPALALNAIRNAVIEICERGLVWRVDLDAINAKANQGEYDYDAEAPVVRAVELWYDKKRLERVAPAELLERYAHWPSQVGTPQCFTQERPAEAFILVPKPAADLAGAITGKLALKPKRTSTGCEDFIFEQWLEPVAHGAKARLFAMKKKPWTDNTLAGHHQGLFNAAVATAALAAAGGFTGKPKRIRAHFL